MSRVILNEIICLKNQQKKFVIEDEGVVCKCNVIMRIKNIKLHRVVPKINLLAPKTHSCVQINPIYNMKNMMKHL